MKTIKVFANIFKFGQQRHDAKLFNVKNIREGTIGWVITLSCGTEVILPPSTIFTIEDSK